MDEDEFPRKEDRRKWSIDVLGFSFFAFLAGLTLGIWLALYIDFHGIFANLR